MIACLFRILLTTCAMQTAICVEWSSDHGESLKATSIRNIYEAIELVIDNIHDAVAKTTNKVMARHCTVHHVMELTHAAHHAKDAVADCIDYSKKEELTKICLAGVKENLSKKSTVMFNKALKCVADADSILLESSPGFEDSPEPSESEEIFENLD